jgi:predicted outer membrane repeat protein
LNKSLAINSAVSLPGWLEEKENFSLSGGIGFSAGNETALGFTGIARVDRNVSAFGGGAVATDGKGWAGKAGVRVGW